MSPPDPHLLNRHEPAVGDGAEPFKPPSAIMAFDPFYSSSPSDSGLLDGVDLPFAAGKPMPRREARPSNVPDRDEYVAPVAGPVDAESPEDALREVPLPEGYMARLRGLVNDL